MSTKIIVWLTAIFCAIVGLFIIYYGYTAIYSLSGFTSIFVGVVTILFAVGLTKGHQLARIGALFIFIISSTGCVWWLYIIFQQQTNTNESMLGEFEYICIAYVFLSLIAIILLILPSTRKFFSDSDQTSSLTR